MKKMTMITAALLVLFFFLSFRASITVTGIVTDSETGTALPGVNIIEKGTSNGCITDLNGRYTISLSNEKSILVFSYLGYVTKEAKIAGRTQINLALEPDISGLEEIVVIGYGTRQKSDQTGSVSSVTLGSPSDALQGRVAGILVKKEKETIGTGSQIQIRGCSSLSYEMTTSDFNTEGYSSVHENGYKDVKTNPLSTFSIDVDAASYSNLRRFLNYGQKPPIDAIRIEEMINYFDYDYPQPKGEVPFAIITELAECPWNKESKLLHIGLQGKSIETDNLPPSNLVFLIDVSGSMSDENKLPLLKSAFKLLVGELRANDRVAMVVYAGASGLVLPSTPGSEKQTIIDALERLQSGGSTAGAAGLQLAYEVAEKNFLEEGNNRIILATDGDFNIGQSSNAEMERLIEKEREKGISISVLGFGMGNFKDDKMEIIADKGNGNYAYIDNIQEAKKVFVNEFGGTLFTIAKDVKIQIEFNPAKVYKYRLVGYENRLLNEEDFDNDKIDAGELGSGHTVTALYEIVLNENTNKNIPGLKYQTVNVNDYAKETNELVNIKLRYKEPAGLQSKLIETAVADNARTLEQTSENFRFSAAVAEFGMFLRDSEFKGSTSLETTLNLAKNSLGKDDEGYRSEFLRLVKSAGAIR
jgi:Ca-activated chloride channel family protein